MDVGPIDPARTRELRRRVLRPELGPDDPLPGDDLPGGVHIGALDGADVVGTCFVYEDPCYWRPEVSGAWHLRQMATAPERRGEGIGAAVLAAAIATVRGRGAQLLWCHARETAVGFYAAHGLQAHGEVFIDPNHPVPHRRMSVELPPESTSSVQ